MSDRRYVPTRAIHAAVKGREHEVLEVLQIDWRAGRQHINCPYPAHADEHPSWRWDDSKVRAYCSCIEGSHSIFDVVVAVEAIDFETAKVRVAEILGLGELIQKQASGNAARHLATDAESLLNAPIEDRNDALPCGYLAYRLNVLIENVPIPTTPTCGLGALGYFDPPPSGSKAKPKIVGRFPCAVFGTKASDGRTHAHRIYIAPGGAGKADLGSDPDGHPRDPKKSAKVLDGVSRAGCAVLWGDPTQAPHLLLTEGIETGAAVAFAFRDEIANREVAVAAAISATGMEAFQPYPATRRVTICADRDEAEKPGGKRPSRRGESAARAFCLRHYDKLQVEITLPREPGQTVDWLDALLRDGPDRVRLDVLFAAEFEPTEEELQGLSEKQSAATELEQIRAIYPLPEMDNQRLVYARTAGGRIKVHQVAGFTTDPISGLVRPQLIPIATPFGVPARLRHADQHDDYGLRCVVQDMNGQPRAVDFDRSEMAKLNATEIRGKLFAAGLRIEARGDQIAVECLKAADPTCEILVYRRPGWHPVPGTSDPVFICPSGEVVGAPEGPALELAASARMDPESAAAGSFEDWQHAAAAAVAMDGCPHWTLGVIAGLVGPLISLIAYDTCGINLSGLSSSGKSTAQRLAVSSWSTPDIKRPGLAQSARATANAMEALAQRATATVLSLDELLRS
jgi:hypothetical protein